GLPTWGRPDLILMNPPFVSWGDMGDPEKASVRQTLGPLLFGRPDTAIAFLAKALRSLRAGCALATVIPASLLESRAAEKLRSMIASDENLAVRVIGRFRNFNYFS